MSVICSSTDCKSAPAGGMSANQGEIFNFWHFGNPPNKTILFMLAADAMFLKSGFQIKCIGIGA